MVLHGAAKQLPAMTVSDVVYEQPSKIASYSYTTKLMVLTLKTENLRFYKGFPSLKVDLVAVTCASFGVGTLVRSNLCYLLNNIVSHYLETHRVWSTL